MAITKVINDAVNLNQTSDYSGLKLPVGTTEQQGISFNLDYLVVAGGGGTAHFDGPGGGGAGGLITSYNNLTTTTNTLSFPSGKTAIATYMLNGNATDVSGTYNGTANSYVSYNTGKYGGAATFDGASSYINIPSGIYSAITGPFTLSAWVNTTSSGSYKIIIGMGGVNGVAAKGLTMWMASNGTLYASWGNGSTEDYWAVNATTSINTGDWFHVAITVDGLTNPVVKGYVNGVPEGSGTTGSDSITFDTSFTIGARDMGGSVASYWDGSIDQVRIYDSALSSTDVTNIYNNEVQINSGGGAAATATLALTGGTPYIVTVGEGGTKAAGSDSVFYNITSNGGGSGGGAGSSSGYNGGNGGSGGGGSGANYLLPGGTGTAGQGYAGGRSAANTGGSGYPAGGGGGASAKGQTLSQTQEPGGTGGDGVIVNILNSTNAALSYIGEVSSSNVYYAGGGGGSAYATAFGTGGLGGGGDGMRWDTLRVANNGTTNTGGGAGGEDATGGSGVVVLRYATADVTSFTTSGSLITPSATDTVANTAYPVANQAYYKLDGNVNEATGTYTANAYGITYSNGGVYNQAAKFDGSGYIDSGYTAVSSTSASISFWVNIAAYTTYGGFAIDSTGTGAQARFTLGQGGAPSNLGNLWVSVGNGSTSWHDETTVSLAGYGLNTWFHLVGTVNGTTVKIYINGSLIHTFTSSVSYVGGGQHNYYFGGWGNSLKLNGLMDQIRFYSTDLSQAYVTDLYKEHYKTLYTEGSDTVLIFNRGTGNINFTYAGSAPPTGAIRTNTDSSPGSANSGIEVYNGTEFKTFSATLS